MQIQNKQRFYTLVILLVVAAAAAILLCEKSRKMDSQMVQNQPVQNPSVQTTQPEDVDTSDWKTYTNKQYGFSVKYPVSTSEGCDLNNVSPCEWTVKAAPSHPEEISFGTKFSLQNGYTNGITIISSNKDLNGWEKYNGTNNVQLKDVTIDGKSGQELYVDGNLSAVFVKEKNWYYKINVDSPIGAAVINAFLDNFHFLNQN